MYARTISLSRTSYSIFISGGLYCRIYAFYVHYPEEGNNNTLTLTFRAKFASIIIERSIVLKNYVGIKFEGVASFFRYIVIPTHVLAWSIQQ